MTQARPTRPLTDADLTRFHMLGPQVLEGRTLGYFLEPIDTAVHYILAGVLPIVGVAWFGWSASNWLVFLIAGCWIGFVCDCFRLKYLKQEIQDYCDRVVDNTFVSVVSEAMRSKKGEIVKEHIPRRPEYDKGAFADLVMGTMATVVVLVTVWGELTSGELDRTGFYPALAGFLGWRVLATVMEIRDHRVNPKRKPVVKLAFGLRGAAMFVVMFIVLFFCDEERVESFDPRYVVYVVNGLLILIGLLNLGGLILMINETRWLKKYFDQRTQQPIDE